MATSHRSRRSSSTVSPTRIDVVASTGTYPIFVGAGALAALPSLLDQAAVGTERVVISSPLVWQLHGDAIGRAVAGAEPILVPDGERSKTIATVGRVYDALLQRRADRTTTVIAVG